MMICCPVYKNKKKTLEREEGVCGKAVGSQARFAYFLMEPFLLLLTCCGTAKVSSRWGICLWESSPFSHPRPYASFCTLHETQTPTDLKFIPPLEPVMHLKHQATAGESSYLWAKGRCFIFKK